MNRIARLAIASCTMTCIFSLNSIAQTPETDAPPAPPAATNAKPTVGFSSYVDTYYASDNDRSASANRSMLNALAPNKNTAGVNLMQVTGTIDAPNYRAKATLHYGDLPRVSWLADGADPLTPAASLQEAYAGVSFANGLWIDAGYFLTHIGGEVIQAKDNWLSTLAMVTQFEPFFQAGLRVNYDAHPNLSLQGLLLNGYNRFTDNNNSKSIGYMITYRPDANLNFTLGGLSGNEQPNGAASANRLYHSLVMNATPSSDFLIRAQADVALQQAVGDGASSTSTVGGYVAMRYIINDYFAISERTEYYQDTNGMLTGALNLNAYGQTLGMEYHPLANLYIRGEVRAIIQTGNSAAGFTNQAGGAAASRIEEVMSVGVSF